MNSTYTPLLTTMIAIIVFTASERGVNADVIDDFESGAFSTNWEGTDTWTVNTTPGDGAAGSDSWASSSAGTGALAVLYNDSTTGVSDFFTELDFRVQTSVNRQFNIQVKDSATVTGVGGATVNVRYEGGAFSAFDGATWQNLGLGGVTDNDWHSFRIDGSDWGTATASYTVTVNGNSTGPLTFFQTGDPTVNQAFGFNVNAVFGGNPGFDVDNVNSTFATAVPEPSSFAMIGIAAFGTVLLRRRK